MVPEVSERVETTWRCQLGREQVRACKADDGYCYVGEYPHGAWVPRGETTRHWSQRVMREWLERRRPT